MTHQNHQTNGASLEDCHTNFFALTELYGIKWRKLVWGETSGGGGGGADGDEGAAPLADPVISSYARCLAGDILCVWRRVPSPQPVETLDYMAVPAPPAAPPLSLRAAKELWIFWYGEEPDLNGLVAPELITSQGEQGSWESGLSYECRSLLFKALHNLIERCLLSRDFVRLGKWFVQPYDGDEEDVGKSPWHLSFSFAFFLHGESTVCASVDVRQHPPVRTLTAKRLAKINSPDHNGDAKVILAPFGLEGRLTGREWGEADAATARLLDAWRHLYPLEQGCGAVEVVCGGSRMRYPSPYALVTDMEPGARAPPPRMAPRALTALTTPAPHQSAELCFSDPAADKNDDFVDPTRKTPCTCTKVSTQPSRT
ncbi:mediator of RNA polymerase II transcription subunit 13-like [Manduca sexta]|uniref:mediator of RNA polymerase II transcription subunit 13-like n=1 Tax=Manduca sexta TaxID=7130 RepID=UPI00188E6F1F|nr:mediator of RNA polymerase II transcription subunit 13-like [Manduca sexta]